MTKTKIGKIIVYVLLLLAVVAAIGVIAHFTNGFTSDFQTFYVTVNGKDVMGSSGGFQVSPSEPLKVDVKYTFGFANDEQKGYSVKIVPNTSQGEDFDFTVGDETHKFYSEKDLSAGFTIKRSDDSFTIAPKGGTLTDVLKAVYPDREISDCEQYGYPDMFTAVITSYNGEASVQVNFVIDGTTTGVILDKEVIVF